MGVHGLWRLIEPSGKPVPLETLENKVLAVDVSIWLHQAVKGFQDAKGGSVPNAHLLGIYHRVCKLLYFKIKPIFVFDGGVPVLKKETIAKRTQFKLKNVSEADRIQKQLLSTLLKHTAVSKVLTEKIEASIGTLPKPAIKSTKDDMYKLPENTGLDSTISSSDEESFSESTTDSSPSKSWDLHTVDMESVHFKSLPVDVRHEILTDLKETRKQSSWGKLHELPKVSDDFSVYQMRRLLKRQAVQVALEDAEKEMGGKSLSLAELESILEDQGVITNQNVGRRIASDENTKYLLVKDVKKAMEDARKKELQSDLVTIEENKETDTVHLNEEDVSSSLDSSADSMAKPTKTIADQEYEDDLQRAIALSLECEPSTSQESSITSAPTKSPEKTTDLSFLDNFKDADFVSSSSDEDWDAEVISKVSKIKNKKNMSSAESYMLEYSGLTPNEIAKLLSNDKKQSKTIVNKSKMPTLREETVTSTVRNDNDKTDEDSQNFIDSGVENTVEVMSSSGSDSEGEIKPCSGLNIIVNTEPFNEDDDLFSDIFSQQSTEIDDKKAEKIIKPVEKHSDKPLDQKLDECQKETNLIEKTNKLLQSGIKDHKDLEKADILKESESICELRPVDDATTLKDEVNLKDQEFKKPHKSTISEKELQNMKDQLQKDTVELMQEKSTKERLAGNITDQMYQEAQELLELFGVPYLIAPMEAEAQCAFLDAIDLTDGTITDDSDIWLFGGRTVYKNFFNQSKYVMEFRAEDISHHFKLTREQMILLALLVGSDYTVGLQGVGPVTAMEILAAFPPSKGKVNEFSLSHTSLLSGLNEFRSWFTKGKSPGPGRSSLKSKLRNISFTENFPSFQVVQAYLDPKVETSREKFSWGRPNEGALLEYAKDKFGWTKSKTEEIIKPVMKKIYESKHQKSIRDYFKSRFKVHSAEAEKKMSKRVKSAITNMGKDPSEIVVEELEADLKKGTNKRQPRKKKLVEKQIPETSHMNKEPRKQQPRKKKVETEAPEFKKSSNNSDEIVDDKPASNNSRRNTQPKKVNLNKLKSDEDVSTSTKQPTEPTEKEYDLSEKIDLIRRRRKLKEAKAAVDLKKAKLVKAVQRRTVPEIIPEDLQVDEEVGLLNDVFVQSSHKIDEINKSMEERLANLKKNSQEPSQLSIFSHMSPKPSTSRRPVQRVTRVPKKEVIPQRERDKMTLMRNKLKAIEVFRKGKRGPGYVPKKSKKKILPKTDAGLSESSGDD